MSDEIAKAQTAKPSEDTIFGKIARKEIKVDLIHDDDQVSFVLFFCRKRSYYYKKLIILSLNISVLLRFLALDSSSREKN